MIEVIIFKNNLGFLDHVNQIGGYLHHQGNNETFYKDAYKTNYKERELYKDEFKIIFIWEE